MYLRLLKMGVDFICSDYPHLVKHAQEKFEFIRETQSVELKTCENQIEDVLEQCSQESEHSDLHDYQLESANMDSDEYFLKGNFDSDIATSAHSSISTH